jgi:hypothetical protein
MIVPGRQETGTSGFLQAILPIEWTQTPFSGYHSNITVTKQIDGHR